MRTRIVAIVAVAMVAFCAASSKAQKPVGTPEVAFGSKKLELPEAETTVVKGKITAKLTGLWLTSEEHALWGGEERTYPLLQLYRIDADEKGTLSVHWLAYVPPPPVDAKLKKAQAEQKSWAPDKDDITAIAAALAAGPPRKNPDMHGKHEIVAFNQLDAATQKSKPAQGSIFVIQSLLNTGVQAQPTFGQSYFVTKATPDELSGQMTMGAVPTNAVGVPLPLGTKGTFRWFKLASPAAAPTPSPATDAR